MRTGLFFTLLLFILFISCSKGTGNPPTQNTQVQVYQNGYLSTGSVSNSGVSAPSGANWSELQSNTGTTITNVALGFACQYNNISNYRIADDFTVPLGQVWNVSKISVYAFTETPGIAPFDVLRLRIWNGNPSLNGSSIVFGDLTNNVLAEVIDSLTYCIHNSSTPAPGIPPSTANKVWKLSANVNKTLSSGTYWLEWQVHSTSGKECFTPPVKVSGKRGLPEWNGLVYNSLNVWQGTSDIGNPGAFPAVRQDLPFEIKYSY